jgi:hypothetical protein
VTPDQVVPAGTTAVPISTRITGLIPGEAYDIDLEATNSAGQVTATQRVALTTPSHPVFTVRLSHDVIRLGQPFEVTVKEGGSYDSEQAVDAWIAKAPYRHWVDAGPATPTGRGRLFEYPCPPPNQYDGGCSWLDRNFRVRVQQGSHRSRARHVYVYPNTVLTTEREKYNTSPYLDLTYSAGVHRTSGAYPREQVYFYSSPARHGPYTRVASVRLRARREYKAELLIARARIYSPQAVYTIACIPHQLFRDMGRPFRVRWCGSRRLH